jgi:hypothetical protein
MSFFEAIRNKIAGKSPDDADQPLESASDQSADEQALASFVKKKFEESRSQANRVAQEGNWMTNIAYLMGVDSVYYDTQTRNYKPVNRQGGVSRNRLRSNQILPAVQNRLARLCKVPPRWDVRPNSMDHEDKEAARLGLEVLTMLWDKLALNSKRILLGMWLQECGHAYLTVSHDDTLGEPLIDPETDELEGYEGEVRVDVTSAFEGFPDPLASNMEECSWWGKAKVRKLEYFKSHFPERGHLVKAEDAWLLSTQYELRINSLNSASQTPSGGTTQQMKDAAIELTYYEKRSRKRPKGRLVIVSNGVILKDDELPVGEIPVVKFDDIVIAGKFYSESTITHARPLQDYYNRMLQKRARWVDKMLAGKYLAEKRHGLSKESLNDDSGEVVEYTAIPNAAPPTAMVVPSIPSYVYEEGKEVMTDMNAIFGLSEVSRGQLPSAGIPAVGMQLLLEQDETRIGIETEQHEHGWAKLGQLLLMYVGAFYKTERTLKTKGNALEYAIKKFSGADLKGNYDVSVVRGSTIPSSKSMRRQELLNLYHEGLLGNPQDANVRQKVLGFLEYGDVAEIYESDAIKKNQVQRTIQQLEQGQIPEVYKLDPHELHVIMKTDYRNSEKWALLAPEIQQIFDADIDQHLMQYATIKNPALNNPPPGLGAPPPGPLPTIEDGTLPPPMPPDAPQP